MRFVGITDAVAVHFRDISVLALRERQQAAAAGLGLRAISGVPLEDLFTYAVELVQSALVVDFVYVVQLRTDREQVGEDTDGDGKVVQPGQRPGQSHGTDHIDKDK